MTAPRPGCATTTRTTAATVTEQVLLSLPIEPSVGSEVEARSADGYREGGWVRVDDSRAHPDASHRRWAPSNAPTARAIDRATWREVAEYVIRYGCKLWLIRGGPAADDVEAQR